jgi:hypothetical protein
MRSKLLFIIIGSAAWVSAGIGAFPWSTLAARRARCRGERGQTTAEYALVLVGASALALLLITWATKTNQVSRLLDLVISHIAGKLS